MIINFFMFWCNLRFWKKKIFCGCFFFEVFFWELCCFKNKIVLFKSKKKFVELYELFLFLLRILVDIYNKFNLFGVDIIK